MRTVVFCRWNETPAAVCAVLFPDPQLPATKGLQASNKVCPVGNRPHIVIFNPDQWRGDVLGHANNPAAVTPNLDRMVAQDAVSFRNAFCQNTVCTPSRCSFMTGWYPHVRGHRTMHHMLHMDRGEPSLLKILKDSGYCVWWGGKNDLVPGQDGFAAHSNVKFEPTQADYDRWDHIPRPSRHRWTPWRGEPESDTYFSFFAGRLDRGPDQIYCDRDWANVLGACDFIRSYDGGQPLCIYLPLGYPHPPYGVEEPWFGMIDRENLPPRAPTPDGWKGKPSLLRGIWERQNMQAWTERRWTELRATYYGMCARLDHQFGMLTDALREAGLYDDSAVFLFSDHGDFTGDYGLVEKTQNTFEDCLSRVPFIIKPPADVPVRPRVSAAMVELVDFPATVYELAAIDPGYPHFGQSLVPVITGEKCEHRDAVFCEGGRLRGERQAMELESWPHQVPGGLYWPRLRLQASDDGPYHTKAAMCRNQNYKYVRRLYEQDELYNLQDDPQEMNNIIANPEVAVVSAELKERLLSWYMQTCDVVPFETDRR